MRPCDRTEPEFNQDRPSSQARPPSWGADSLQVSPRDTVSRTLPLTALHTLTRLNGDEGRKNLTPWAWHLATSCEQEAGSRSLPPSRRCTSGSSEAHRGELSWDGTHPSLNGSSLADVPVFNKQGQPCPSWRARASPRECWHAPGGRSAEQRLPCPGCRAHVGSRVRLPPLHVAAVAEELGITVVPRAVGGKPEGRTSRRRSACSCQRAASFPAQQGPSQNLPDTGLLATTPEQLRRMLCISTTQPPGADGHA